VIRSAVSLTCAVRTAGSAMIDLAYWNGDLAICDAKGVSRIGESRPAQARTCRICRNRLIREGHGVIVGTAIIGPRDLLLNQGIADRPDGLRRKGRSAARAPFGKKPGLTLLSM